MRRMRFWLGLCLLLSLVTMSCTRVIDDELVHTDETNTIRVMTRSEAPVSYPLTLYAFDVETREMCAMVKADEAGDELALHLPEGAYHLLALGGADECKVPSMPTLDDVLTLPAVNRLSSPLQMGMGDIMVAQHATVNITLYHQVSAIDLCLRDIPKNVEAVNVGMSLLCNKLALNGSTSGSVTTSIDLTRQADGSWTAPTFYTLPTSSKKLTLSITTVTADDERETYAYTYPGSLEANTPYALIGSFLYGFSVNGVVSLAGWREQQMVTFSFGHGNGENDEEEDAPEVGGGGDDDETVVGGIPAAGTMWQGHFVGAVDETSDTEAELLLLSLSEWRGVPSAYNVFSPGMAEELVAAYNEDGMTGWSIPTKDEARLIRESIGNDRLEATNLFLASQDVVGLTDNLEDDEGNMVRYLCEGAQLAFVWDVGTSNTISKCGTKRTYYLRAIKRVKVSASNGD